MYTEEQEHLRMALHQFFGSILINSNLKDKEMKKQSLVALVVEELIKICKDDNIDIIAAKPILRGAHHILSIRKQEIEEVLQDKNNHLTDDIKDLINKLNIYIESL